MIQPCLGEHSFYVAEVVGVETEGKVYVLALCTHCGEFVSHVAEVGKPGSQIRLLLEEKKKKNKE